MVVSVWSHESRYLYEKTQEYLNRDQGDYSSGIFLSDFFVRSQTIIEGLDITKEKFIKYSSRLEIIEFVFDLKLVDHFDTVYCDDGESPLSDKERKYIYSFFDHPTYGGNVYTLPEKVDYVELLKRIDESGTQEEFEFLEEQIIKKTSHFVRAVMSEVSRGETIMMLDRWLRDLNILLIENELDIKYRIDSIDIEI